MSEKEAKSGRGSDTTIEREIHHVAVDGVGSVSVIEFHHEGETLRLLITVNDSTVTADWLDQRLTNRILSAREADQDQ